MIREDFPIAGSDYSAGVSDGWEYRTVFAGSNLQASLEMVAAFLEEEGYGNVPLPKNADDLSMFRIPNVRNQILLFADNGYVHNPIKVLFNSKETKPKTLTLHIYNEKEKNHLLRFHGKIVVEKAIVKTELLGFNEK